MRLALSMLIGLGAALGLFALMQMLIRPPADGGVRVHDTDAINFVRVAAEETTRIKPRQKPPPPPPRQHPPAAPELPSTRPSRPPLQELALRAPALVPGASGEPYLGGLQPGQPTAEGDVVPIVRIEPQYPREALLAGTTGWVRIEFTIDADGTVTDPQVIDAEPARVFNRAALRAILRWKFKPRVIDGVATSQRASQVIEFQLEG